MKKLLFISVLFLCVFVNAQDNSENTPLVEGVTVEPYNDNIFIMNCTGGSEFGIDSYNSACVALAGDEGILLIDAGFGSTSEALRDSLKNLGNGKLVKIINTHHHGDHTLGNSTVKGDATITAHQYVVDALSGDFFNLPGTPTPNCPDSAMEDSLVFTFNGEKIRVIHTPDSHTSGDVYVHFVNSKLIACGDLFFSDEIPYIDLTNGGTVAGYHKQIKSFISDFPDDITFQPSHGQAYNKSDLKTYDSMLTVTTNLVKKAIKQGKTVDDMVKDSLLKDWYDWEGQFDLTSINAWITTIYNEVTGAGQWKSICEPMTEILVSQKAAQAVKKYYELKESNPDDYTFAEAHLNALGYQLINRNRIEDAIAIFKLNIYEYPESANVYDSYAEVLMISGDTAQSIINYEKSLELNPDNTNAVEMLKKIKK